MTAAASANPAKTAPKIAAAGAIPLSCRRIVLTGFMGAGKTTVGRELAALLNWNFLDLDSHLEERATLTIPEIFTQHGEQHFRRLESSALANALTRSSTILALGGGTPEQLTNRLLLEQTPGTVVIFLDAPFVTLFDRCMLQSFSSPMHQRPVLSSPTEAEARFRERTPFYKRLAKHTVATADLTTQQAAEQIVALLHPKEQSFT